jgi:hypothetical protein
LGQVPQLNVPPHPFVGLPHCPAAHVLGTQHLPPMHCSLLGHVLPHTSVPPHPSETVPQSSAAHVVFFVQHEPLPRHT